MKNIGILTQSQCCISSSSSDSTGSDDCTTSENTSSSSSSSDSNGKTIEPEVNQDHYASPFQRQSAKDGAKVMTCFGLFIFLIFNPLSLFAGGKSDILSSGKLISCLKGRHLAFSSIYMHSFIQIKYQSEKKTSKKKVFTKLFIMYVQSVM